LPRDALRDRAWREETVINISARFLRSALGPPQAHCGKRVDSFVRSCPREGELSVSQQRLDEAKVETLRAWGEGLQIDPREELRAAGRAITMLVEEIERLNIDLWHARTDRRASSGRGSPATGDASRPLPPPLPGL
jgi:hypothetical protein